MTELKTRPVRDAMVMAEGAGASVTGGPPQRRRTRPPMLQRARQFLLRNIWVHIVLIAGACLFLYPFLWMLGMTFKTSQEATNPELFPPFPHFRSASPYVVPAATVTAPRAVTPAKWKLLLPALQALARKQLAGATAPVGAGRVAQGPLYAAATTRLLIAALHRTNRTIWRGTPVQCVAACQQQMTPALAHRAIAASLARLELFKTRVAANNGDVFILNASHAADHMWKVISGAATLRRAAGKPTLLQYHFASAGSPAIVLQRRFFMPVKMVHLHRVMVGIRNDDTWRRITATLTVNGRTWRATRSVYLAGFRRRSLLYQPPGFDDQTNQPKVWVTLHPVSPGRSKGNVSAGRGHEAQGKATPLRPAHAANATLTLTIKPTSTVHAMWGKAFRNYARAFRSVPFWTYTLNSVSLVVLEVMGSIFSSAFVAYAFARLRWPGRGVAFALVLSTMMLPAQVTMIPSFMIWRTLGWYNTLNPLWVGTWFGNAFFIFLMTQHMKTIPLALEEAARLDGLNSLQTWWYIILPQVKPALAAIGIMAFMNAWNDFMGPLIYLRDQSKFPLSLGLFAMQVDQGANWTMLMAGNMLMVLPVVVIFFLLQRYFIEGASLSGMKG